jgi:hypothetical protein
MAQFTKSTGDNGSVRYKDGGRFVKGEDVPANVKEALDANPEGTVIDELGDVVDPSTDTDEGTGDDDSVQTATPPVDETTVDDESADDESEDDSEEDDSTDESAGDDGEEDDEEEPEAPAAPAKKKAGKKEIGNMGFPAKNGKTLSIFSDNPHETVKNVGGILVPLTLVELNGDVAKGVEPKTDTEIIERLKKLGKL